MAWYTFTNVFTGEQVWREEQPGTPIEDPESARFLIALTGLAFSPWLYPLLTVAAGAAAFVAGEIVDAKGLTPPASYAMTLGAVLPVFVVGMRVEQRLGSLTPYRWLRHLMRLRGTHPGRLSAALRVWIAESASSSPAAAPTDCGRPVPRGRAARP